MTLLNWLGTLTNVKQKNYQYGNPEVKRILDRWIKHGEMEEIQILESPAGIFISSPSWPANNPEILKDEN